MVLTETIFPLRSHLSNPDSVRVTNILRDVIVDFTEADELTKLNAQMVAVDRILNIISVIISFVALTVKPSYCVWLILSSSILATISQILRKRLYNIFIILRKAWELKKAIIKSLRKPECPPRSSQNIRK